MKAIATYIMKSRGQAIAFAAGFAMLSLIFPLFSLLSAATISLVTLRTGLVPGAMVIAAASVLVYAISLVLSSAAMLVPSIVSLTVLLAIAWLLSAVLRTSRSLSLAITTAAVIGMVFVAVFHLVIGDTTAWWQSHFQEFFSPSMENVELDQQAAFNQSLQNLANIMTGFVAMAFVLNAILSLLVARAWQASLYNPGGFKQEFHSLQLGKKVAIFSLGIAALTMVPNEMISTIMRDSLFLVLMMYVLQGISVAHAVVAIKKLQWVWLVGVYLLVFIMSQLVAVTGYIDTWMDFRRRVAERA